MADNIKPASWSQCSPEALNGAVDLFCSFIAQPDRAAVKQWVLERAEPSEIYNNGYDDWYTELCDEVLSEQTVQDFCRSFLPNTQEWFDFVVEFEGRGLVVAFYGRSLELVGRGPRDWPDDGVDLLDQVLDCWKFDYSYGIWEDHGGPRRGPLRMWRCWKTAFFGRGRWKFSDLLTHLDEYTRQWIAAHGGPEKEYAQLLALMGEERLEIDLDFLDPLPDGITSHETGTLYSDGTTLHYRQKSVGVWEG